MNGWATVPFFSGNTFSERETEHSLHIPTYDSNTALFERSLASKVKKPDCSTIMSPLLEDEVFSKYRIPKVEMPSRDAAALRKYGNALADVLERHEDEVQHSGDHIFDFGLFEEVEFGREELPKEPGSLFILDWLQRSNEVIGGLNVAVHDLLLVVEQPHFVGRPYSVRLTFLWRSYTNEFFRMKELFNIHSKSFYKEGIITKPDLEESRELFYDAFEEMLSLRNMLLHQPTFWKQPEHHDLTQIEAIGEGGSVVINEKTGRAATGKPQARDLAQRYLEIASREGRRLSETVTEVLKVFSKLLERHETREQ